MNNPEVSLFFPEPVFRYKFEDYKNFNLNLKKYIYELQKENSSGQIKSNRGGWHSNSFKLNDTNSIQHKFAMETTKYVFDAIQTYGWVLEPDKVICSEMWAIINKKNSYTILI